MLLWFLTVIQTDFIMKQECTCCCRWWLTRHNESVQVESDAKLNQLNEIICGAKAAVCLTKPQQSKSNNNLLYVSFLSAFFKIKIPRIKHPNSKCTTSCSINCVRKPLEEQWLNRSHHVNAAITRNPADGKLDVISGDESRMAKWEEAGK